MVVEYFFTQQRYFDIAEEKIIFYNTRKHKIQTLENRFQ